MISILELDNERRTVVSLGPIRVFDVRPLLGDIKEISDEETRARSRWISQSMRIASTVSVGAYTRQNNHDGQYRANEVVHRIEHAQ